MSLNRFVSPIEVAREPISGKYTAYVMDSTIEEKDMRKAVDLGTCHCCDYFLLREEFIILIEETQLLKTVKKIRDEYDSLDEVKKDEIVNKCIRDEMQLKVYGTMLVLCRLSMKYTSARDLIQGRKYQFWLVASSIDTTDEKIYFDNQKDSLKGDLTGVLGKTLLNDVDVLSADTLKERLSDNATTP